MKKYVGVVYVDGKLFTHPNMLMGVADATASKVTKQLRENIRDTFTKGYINSHIIELKVENLNTNNVTTILF